MYEHLNTFGHWLAGFIDGEGSFVIQKSASPHHYCVFRLAVRDDDTAIIYSIHDALGGIGNIHTIPRRGTSNPQVGWEVVKQSDILLLCSFLDEYPLRAKKARDYSIWRGAAHALSQMRQTQEYDWPIMAKFKEQLATVRLYPES